MSPRRRRLMLLGLAAAVMLGTLVFAAAASAHECTTTKKGKKETTECHPSPVYPNWRPQYVPLFGVNGTRCETQECLENRRDAQRWRDENGCANQFCTWNDFNFSVEGSPTSVHGGSAGDHSLSEGAHSSEGHGTNEGNHDTHGGSIYYDLCIGSDAGTSYGGRAGACDDPSDTQIGLTIVDHNPCGLPPVPGIPFPCIDEYHVIRPLDSDYTQGQIAESQEQFQYDMDNPETYLCGYEGVGEQDQLCDAIRPPAE